MFLFLFKIVGIQHLHMYIGSYKIRNFFFLHKGLKISDIYVFNGIYFQKHLIELGDCDLKKRNAYLEKIYFGRYIQ